MYVDYSPLPQKSLLVTTRSANFSLSRLGVRLELISKDPGERPMAIRTLAPRAPLGPFTIDWHSMEEMRFGYESATYVKKQDFAIWYCNEVHIRA
jgi:hypothetical protein